MNDLTRSAPALIPYADIERMGVTIAKSGLFGVKTPEQAIALMLIAQAEGLHPAIAARDYHVIQGRPCLRADAMLARFQASGGKVEWKRYDDEVVTGIFSHPIGGSVEITWSTETAKRAGLVGRDVWKQFPRQMLRARCISEGIRTVFPGVIGGMLAPEEVQDLPAASNGEPAPIPRQRTAALKQKLMPPAAVDTNTGELIPDIPLEAALEELADCKSPADVVTFAELMLRVATTYPDQWPEETLKQFGAACRERKEQLMEMANAA